MGISSSTIQSFVDRGDLLRYDMIRDAIPTSYGMTRVYLLPGYNGILELADEVSKHYIITVNNFNDNVPYVEVPSNGKLILLRNGTTAVIPVQDLPRRVGMIGRSGGDGISVVFKFPGSFGAWARRYEGTPIDCLAGECGRW